MILIGNKLANKGVKVCFYGDFQGFWHFLQKKTLRFFKTKKRSAPKQVGIQ